MTSGDRRIDPLRILLVEDDLDQAHLVKFLLEEGGPYQCTLAQDGLRGEKLAQEGGWDLVITDLNLPGADGFTVFETSRRHHPDTPVLATTGYTGPEYVEEARRRGVDDILLKPLDREDLFRRVETLTARPAPPPSPGEDNRDTGHFRVLAISLRPGDAEVGCAGTLLLHADREDRVILLTLTHGAGGERGTLLQELAKAAGRELGIRFYVGNAGSGDDHLHHDLARLVSGAIREIRPDIVYLPTGEHADPGYGVVERTILAEGARVGRILAFDPGDAAPGFHPTRFHSVDDVFDRKVGGLEAYREAGDLRLTPETVALSARFFGRHVEGTHAEALLPLRGDSLFSPGGGGR